MATETNDTTVTTATRPDWLRGTLTGIAGGVVFGAMMSVMMAPVIENAIPAMYGFSGGAAGWMIHVSHGAVLGVVFAALARAADLYTVGRTTAVGVAYGVVVWAALAVLVMPVWLQAVGFPAAPAVPNVSVPSLVGHVAYGGVVGAVYAVTDR